MLSVNFYKSLILERRERICLVRKTDWKRVHLWLMRHAHATVFAYVSVRIAILSESRMEHRSQMMHSITQLA